MILFVCLGVILLSGWIQYVWGRRKLRAINNQLQGPPTWPIIGNGIDLMGLTNTGKFNS
jgi:hypothetical protein